MPNQNYKMYVQPTQIPAIYSITFAYTFCIVKTNHRDRICVVDGVILRGNPSHTGIGAEGCPMISDNAEIIKETRTKMKAIRDLLTDDS